jgi:hypothetical protein
MMARTSNDATGQMGLCEYLCLNDVTPHDLHRTSACILEQLGYDDALIGRMMTHKTKDKHAARVTREHYLVPVRIVASPVMDPRAKALDDLDDALREILDQPRSSTKELPAPPRLLTAA